jgi:hypothetical protein
MSVRPSGADIIRLHAQVRFVPSTGDIAFGPKRELLDHLVGYGRRNIELGPFCMPAAAAKLFQVAWLNPQSPETIS